MTAPKALILRSPGTNCDEETAHAFRLAGAEADAVHVRRVLERPTLLDDYQILCIPGGFSYGDDVAAGRILGNEVRLHLADACRRFKDADKLVLGVCNGFQVLMKTGLLDIDDTVGPTATLTFNDSGRYEARWVHLTAAPNACVFLAGVEALELPVAHAEGKFVPRDEAALARLEEEQRLVLRYSTAYAAAGPAPYPANPNGSVADVAGVCDSTGRVLGLMPHPERFVDPTHHPRWTRGGVDSAAGLALFSNATRYFR